MIAASAACVVIGFVPMPPMLCMYDGSRCSGPLIAISMCVSHSNLPGNMGVVQQYPIPSMYPQYVVPVAIGLSILLLLVDLRLVRWDIVVVYLFALIFKK
jgi:hypothetical protein